MRTAYPKSSFDRPYVLDNALTLRQRDPMSSDQTARVLIVVGDASETVDTLYPFYRLQEAGFTPVVAGPERRTFQMVMHEVRPGWTITREWEGYQIAVSYTHLTLPTICSV